MCQLNDGLALHEGWADKDNLKKKAQKGTCAVRTVGLPKHKTAYTSYTAHYWYVPEPFTNPLVSFKLLW